MDIREEIELDKIKREERLQQFIKEERARVLARRKVIAEKRKARRIILAYFIASIKSNIAFDSFSVCSSVNSSPSNLLSILCPSVTFLISSLSGS